MCTALNGIAAMWTALNGIAAMCTALNGIAAMCTALNGIAAMWTAPHAYTQPPPSIPTHFVTTFQNKSCQVDIVQPKSDDKHTSVIKAYRTVTYDLTKLNISFFNRD